LLPALCPLPQPLVLHHRPLSNGGGGQDSIGAAGQQRRQQQQQPDSIAAAADVASEGLFLNSAAAGLEPARKQQLSARHVWREAWQSVTAVFLCYAVTLSLFPGVLAEDLTSELFKSWCVSVCCWQKRLGSVHDADS
jgi:hypothetical protein